MGHPARWGQNIGVRLPRNGCVSTRFLNIRAGRAKWLCECEKVLEPSVNGSLESPHSTVLSHDYNRIDKAARAALKTQNPCILWFTGLSGAGKTTVARVVEAKLYGRGYHTYLLDGDSVRQGLSSDLGFTLVDRRENIRRVGEVATLMVEAGLIVLCALISPLRAERLRARRLVQKGEFIEIYVDLPVSVAEERDTKGLYGKARRGEISNMSGFDSPYEMPEHPDVHLDMTTMTIEECGDRVLAALVDLRVIA